MTKGTLPATPYICKPLTYMSICRQFAKNRRAGLIRKKTVTIHIAIRTKQYATRIDDTIQR